ncbi:hypothetical protein CS369_21720 (plasmid) [Candidatus Symbiopectobacterium sp. 'North America']|uniref:hypothetical protein n=1 Tax=Candidatus Symbiopectobacterium sp. 'North America' TaxID=2794574 RepID=UPI0018C9D1B5|nr:hypothetical protein [Candidatus Symbiopectobacterium sp. 'North America']MBG6246674.1 hypothetical protein [Candidatus Symbiopectobacterium sp. 'North America']
MRELHERYRLALSKMKEMNEVERSGRVKQLSKEELRKFRIDMASHVSEVRIIWCCLAQMKSNITDITESELLTFLCLTQDENNVFSSLSK